MYQRLLAEVRAAQIKYGEQSQPTCTGGRIAQLRRRVREELGAELPDDYAAFLRTQNGLNHNGLFIYASETTPIVGLSNAIIEGIIEANQGWRADESLADYLVFGEGNMDVYVRHLPTGDYRVLSRTPVAHIETHPSFDHLIAAALKAHL